MKEEGGEDRFLLLDCWSKKALAKFASVLGKPIAADECTATMTRTSYARILVEVDVTKPLKREIKYGLPNGGARRTQKVLYEREPRLCTMCRHVGHDADHCSLKDTKRRNRSRSRVERTPRVEETVHPAPPQPQEVTIHTAPPQLQEEAAPAEAPRRKAGSRSRPTVAARDTGPAMVEEVDMSHLMVAQSEEEELRAAIKGKASMVEEVEELVQDIPPTETSVFPTPVVVCLPVEVEMVSEESATRSSFFSDLVSDEEQ